MPSKMNDASKQKDFARKRTGCISDEISRKQNDLDLQKGWSINEGVHLCLSVLLKMIKPSIIFQEQLM